MSMEALPSCDAALVPRHLLLVARAGLLQSRILPSSAAGNGMMRGLPVPRLGPSRSAKGLAAPWTPLIPDLATALVVRESSMWYNCH
jgi:hypothetical protein